MAKALFFEKLREGNVSRALHTISATGQNLASARDAECSAIPGVVTPASQNAPLVPIQAGFGKEAVEILLLIPIKEPEVQAGTGGTFQGAKGLRYPVSRVVLPFLCIIGM